MDVRSEGECVKGGVNVRSEGECVKGGGECEK